jgi:hypothetical protein
MLSGTTSRYFDSAGFKGTKVILDLLKSSKPLIKEQFEKTENLDRCLLHELENMH